MNYFTPADLVQHDAIFNYQAKAGAGFGILPSNEQVFFSARMVQDNNLTVGDTVRVWAVDNYASPETAHFASRWRAVRIQVLARLEDVLRTSSASAAAPAPAPVGVSGASDYTVVMDRLIGARRPWTVNELTHAIAKVSPQELSMPDLIQKVGTRLAAQHRTGDVACVKVYAKVDNDRASSVYFAKDVDVFHDYLDTPLVEEE